MITSALLPILTVALAHLAAAISPGPSFLLVARTAVGVSRRAGLAAALAMGVGAALWAAAALVGLAVIFAQFDWLYMGAKIAGGVFLIWIATRIWRNAQVPLPEQGAAPECSLNQAFRSALWIQLSNPKVAIFFGSIFIALLPHSCRYGSKAWCSPSCSWTSSGMRYGTRCRRPRAARLRAVKGLARSNHRRVPLPDQVRLVLDSA
jgi:threonine/homoserine/homoserine lactone efflux protein